MKINDKIHGFKITRITEISEISASLYEMEHEASGARLFFLDREDNNKTFAIAFKTIPEDSTGVFHIIEHSVLCGSEKYPVKEPFVELLKGSLNTFLNAFTFPDKTMYPVSSRNNKDFLNLMSVYLDAVLHPAILTNENIFRQEGWHYELDSPEGRLTRSGVVLNEMKGAFSSPEELGTYHLATMLYPDTCYRFESGGKPDVIPELTYESFLAAHAKFYHPSNSQIFLDGSVELDSALSLIDSFLSGYTRRETTDIIPKAAKIKPQKREIVYEISKGESTENKTRLQIGYMLAECTEQEKLVAASVLFGAICSTNESPLKKALIDSGLCEDVSFSLYESVRENSLILDFRNVKDGKCDELYRLFTSTVRELVTNGIDKELLSATLNRLEFKSREKDFGSSPKGLIYIMTMLETSLYGEEPAQNLSYGESYAAIREKLSGDYFESLLRSVILENEHRATLIMEPSSTLGEENAKKEAEELEGIKKAMSADELAEIIRINKELKEWQTKPDSEEALASLPALAIEDIEPTVEKIPQSVETIDGITALIQEINTNGIAYTEFLFDVSDLNEEEIFDLRVLVALLTDVDTEAHTALELQNKIKGELGSFGISVSPVTKDGRAKLYLSVTASALDSSKHSIPEITEEILYTSIYKNKDVAKNILRQTKMSDEESFVMGGHLAAFGRACAYTSAEAALKEYYSGYEAYLKIKALNDDFDSRFDELSERMAALAERVFTKERLTVSLTGAADGEFTRALIAIIRSGGDFEAESKIKPLGVRREGILIPAPVAYASMALSLSTVGEELSGSLNVTRSLLSYGYLWNTVRVQGGAYGTGLIVRVGGNVGLYSYRDPSPARTVSCYKGSAEFLREFAESGESITKFIIGAVGDSSPLTSPRLQGSLAISRYLRGIDYEKECQTRREMLATDKDELLRIADIIEKITSTDAVCVVGGKEQLDACSDIIDTVLEL